MVRIYVATAVLFVCSAVWAQSNGGYRFHGDAKSLELTIKDLKKTFGNRYPKGDAFLKRLQSVKPKSKEFAALHREALMANPLLKDLRLLAIRRDYGKNARREKNPATPNLNAYCQNVVNPDRIKSEIVLLTGFNGKTQCKSFYKPPRSQTIVEMDLHFGANKLMFSGGNGKGQYRIYEIAGKDKKVREIIPASFNFHCFDSCYLPDGRIIFSSDAGQQGLPCEHGRFLNSNMYLFNPKTNEIRRITFDQDSDWAPTMREDGSVMYLRWEYSDVPHYHSRILMTMNPDGTNQKAHYGSNSYWPNAMMNSKAIPGAPSQFVTIVSGHHGTGRSGWLALFDVSRGRMEADGAVTMIPGYGNSVKPQIADGLYGRVYPRCLNPFPLGASPAEGAGRYFIVSGKLTSKDLWGVYLADVYGNFSLLYEEEGKAVNEPIPLLKQKMSPIIPDRIMPGSKTATVYIQDVYQGPGLRGIPKGVVKQLRIYDYHFAYGKTGGHDAVGIESSWDVKRIMGTVPVMSDGSASFIVPANTPIAVQPLDSEGRAIQLFRSWFVGMPGERVSCIGCHESADLTPIPAPSQAARMAPNTIKPWLGPERGFAFLREIQPVIDRKCIGCHNGKPRKDGKAIPNFDDIAEQAVPYRGKNVFGGPFPKSYIALCRYVRRPGPESDIHLFNPMEYHASTSILIQLLKKGHQGVKLTDEEWQRLFAWIDMNAPCYGTYTEAQRRWKNPDFRWAGAGKTTAELIKKLEKGRAIRLEMQQKYCAICVDPEKEALTFAEESRRRSGRKPIMPTPPHLRKVSPPSGWPFAAGKAKSMQAAAGKSEMTLNVDGQQVKFRRIPAGKFVMGSAKGYEDEQPHVATIGKAFWMSEVEVLNGLYKKFNPKHSNGYIDILGKDHTGGGILVTDSSYPAIRMSWLEATKFCEWLSKKTGKTVRLPTEAEWEWACRAGSGKDFFFGDRNADFGKYANLADKTIEKFIHRRTYNYMLRVDKVNDGIQAMGRIGRRGNLKTQPNPFGLRDMHGNVAEWTSSDYRPYPYGPKSETKTENNPKVARGGSWCDLPQWATASYRTGYQPYQRVHNVGIRLVIE